MSAKPQMESKAAAVGLAFMAGVAVGLIDKSAMMVAVAAILVIMALWQYRLKE